MESQSPRIACHPLSLLALEAAELRLQTTGEPLAYYDLAHEWTMRVGLPWVSAFWAIRPDALERSGITPEQVCEDFLSSRDHGLAHIPDLVEEWQPRIALPAGTIRTYLTTNIHYTLDEPCLEGLHAFYRYGAELGVLPAAPRLVLL